MILYRTYIFCDHEGCSEKVTIGGIPNLNTVSTTLKNKGWGENYYMADDGGISRKHFCPKCKEQFCGASASPGDAPHFGKGKFPTKLSSDSVAR